ncbi:MAG: DUF504 domain-containing protein [Euryarchaeota archaeon]|nr:DUF504 domain-containing protein [Euryarchaeota archaeon]
MTEKQEEALPALKVAVRGRFPRDVLNELKWRGYDMGQVEVVIVHRGAPGERRVIRGPEITGLGPGFLTAGEATIPYHRIVRIRYREQEIWRRPSAEKS